MRKGDGDMLKKRSDYVIAAAAAALLYGLIVCPAGSLLDGEGREVVPGVGYTVAFVLMLVFYYLLTYVAKKQLVPRILVVCISWPAILYSQQGIRYQTTYLQLGLTDDPHPLMRYLLGFVFALLIIALLEANHYLLKRPVSVDKTV